MKALINKILVAVVGMTLFTAPLAADAASTRGYVAAGAHTSAYVGGPGYRGGYYGGYRGGYYGGYRGWGYGGYRGWGYGGWYGPRVGVFGVGFGGGYYNGWYGWAPGGWYGYYWNGGWYHHRRWSGGIWVYF